MIKPCFNTLKITQKIKTKYRLEYWIKGRKYVRNFGSREQAWNFVKDLGAHQIDITPYQERT